MSLKRLIWIILAAILFTSLVRFFLLDSYRIATGAMEETMHPGDRVMIEKWTLGSRIPQAIGIPFSDNATPRLKLSKGTHRLPGLSTLKHNDLIVFNQPQYGDSIPVNLRPVLISRCVGLPGDGVQLSGQRLFINRKLQKRNVDVQYSYYLDSTALPLYQAIAPERPYYISNDSCFIFLTKHDYSRLISTDSAFKQMVHPHVSGYDLLKTFVPYKGMTLALDSATFDAWQSLINAHEGCQLARSQDGLYLMNGNPATHYTFKQDYYLVLNDHQGFLNDSRTFGLVPASHIMGRSLFILFSPKEKRILESNRP